MVRKWHNSSRGEELFPFVYEGFLAGGLQSDNAFRTPAIKRVERSVLGKLRSISTAMSEEFPNTKEKKRKLNSFEKGTILCTFDQQELDLLVKYIEATPWKIYAVDLGMDAADWVASSSREDDVK